MALQAVAMILGKLSDPLIQEAILLGGVRDDVEFIKRELRWMQCFLKDADAKQKGDERVRNWVREVRDAAYDAEDVIDNFIVKITKLRRRGLACNLLRFSYFSELMIWHKTAKEIERIKQRMREISDSRSNYGIENLGSSAEGTQYISESLRERRHSSPLVREPDVIGFDEDVKVLIARLKEPKTPRRVISIVGMGGSGKTTLAMKVYNSDDVRRHFDCCAWVYVSQQYRVRELLQKIRKKIGLQIDDTAKMNDDEDLKDKLIQFLSGRRYLIVMDDVWQPEVWIGVRVAFPDVTNGSRIIFTTRKKEVGSHADPRSPPHILDLLDKDKSWSLFSKKVFAVGNDAESCSEEMDRIGRQIVAKCGGLPLAIVVLGGLLSRKEKTPNEWSKVLGSVHGQLNRDPENFLGILALSYNDLPYYLKSCFLYFGVFPEDAEINVRKLIHLWVAEGFIQQGQDNITIEEAGEDYLEELLDRNMIQLAQRRPDGGPKTCRIHDLLRDLAISECKEDQFLHIQNNPGSSSLPKARRIAIHHRFDWYVSLSQSTPHLRSLLWCYTRLLESFGTKELKFLCGGFRLLRVLDLDGACSSNLPGEIGELIHLRYLRLRIWLLEGGIECLRFSPFWRLTLPSSIGNLENLQTLDIRGFASYQLPNAIWKMKQLKHLYMDSDAVMMKGPLRVDCLENLQTLIGIHAGRWIERLGKLINLRRLGVVGDLSFYEKGLSDSIAHLGALRTLSFRTGPHPMPALPTLSYHLCLYKIHLSGNMENLPDWCISPPNLTKLTLELSRLEQDPMTMLERLQNLQILNLLSYSYVGKKMVCSTGGFPKLEVLKLQGLNVLEEMLVEQGSMPSLRRLLIYHCFKLKMLPEGLKHVRTLHELVLSRMDDKFYSRLQENEGEDWHKIQHIPSISWR